MRRLIFAVLVMALVALIASPLTVQACGEATGALRITPHGSYYPLPIMLSSPATFTITAIDDVMVEWVGDSINFSKASFTAVSDDSAYVPLSGVSEGARYRVSCLKKHIGVNGTADDTLWYVYGPFLSGPVDQTAQTFTVTLPSTNPRMLVYAIGKITCFGSFSIECFDFFNTRVPPTMPGFVVPDLAPVLLALASFSAFGVYAIKRRKK